MLHVTCQCPRWLAIPFAIWPMFDVCRRSLRSKSLAALNVAGDTMTYNSPIRCCTARSQATPNVASAGARSSSGLSLAGGDELTRAMELIILIDVDSPRVSWVGFTNFTFTFTFTCRPFAFGSYHLHFVYLSGASRRRAVYSDVSGGFVASRPLFDAVLGGLHGGTSSPWLWAQDKSVSSP